jgi:hypothetical protein
MIKPTDFPWDFPFWFAFPWKHWTVPDILELYRRINQQGSGSLLKCI